MSLTVGGVRIVDMPDLGAVSDASSLVGERAGSGRFSVIALRRYIMPNVRDYGAKGDGIADDTAALNAAFATAAPVYLSAGSYRVTAPVTLVAGQIVVAEDANAYDDPGTMPASLPITQIVADNSAGGFISGSAVLTLNDRASIAGFGITSVANVDAVYAPGRFIKMAHIYTRYGRNGANLNAVGPQLYACRFQSASNYGLWGQSFCTDGLFTNTYVVGAGGRAGFYFQNAIKHLFIGCTAEWNSNYGFEFFEASSCSMTCCATDRNGGPGLHISASSLISVVGNLFMRNSANNADPQVHVFLTGTLSGLAFSGNTYRSFNSQDDGSGIVVPPYCIEADSATSVTTSLFADPMTPGSVGFFANTTTDAILRPFFPISPADVPGRYADDAAAAASGVQIGSAYIDTAGIFRQRIA